MRYADDFVVGFEHRADAERFLVELQERMAKFGLELHPEKTRLIEFDRFASVDRRRRLVLAASARPAQPNGPDLRRTNQPALRRLPSTPPADAPLSRRAI